MSEKVQAPVFQPFPCTVCTFTPPGLRGFTGCQRILVYCRQSPLGVDGLAWTASDLVRQKYRNSRAAGCVNAWINICSPAGSGRFQGERLSKGMASNKQAEIARAAVKLFEQKGYHATSVQDIADEVGLQKGSLYHYIHSKEDLLLQIAHQAISDFNHQLEQVIASDLSAREKLVRAIENHITVSVSNLQTTTVLLREAFSLGEDQHKVIQSLTDRYLELWTNIIREGQETGEFRTQHPKLTALALLGACNWVYRWYKTSGEMTAEQIAQVFSDVFLRGLLAGTPAGNS